MWFSLTIFLNVHINIILACNLYSEKLPRELLLFWESWIWCVRWASIYQYMGGGAFICKERVWNMESRSLRKNTNHEGRLYWKPSTSGYRAVLDHVQQLVRGVSAFQCRSFAYFLENVHLCFMVFILISIWPTTHRWSCKRGWFEFRWKQWYRFESASSSANMH